MLKTIQSVVILFIVIFCVVRNSSASEKPAARQGTYFQTIKTDISLPEQAEKNVLKLFRVQNSILVVTTNGVFRYSEGKWNSHVLGSGWQTAILDVKNEVWLASENFIRKENDPSGIKLPAFAAKDTILCMYWENGSTLHIGTTSGLLTFDGNWNALPLANGSRVRSILKDTREDLWIATDKGLFRRLSGEWISMDEVLMANGWNRTYFSLANEAGKPDVLFSGSYAVGAIAGNGDHWVWRGADGLPYGPVTTIRSLGSVKWLGTANGAIKRDSSWHYYSNRRWLPDNRVNDILPMDENSAWIATPAGISEIRDVEMTLSEKAEIFEERINARHERYGLVSRSMLRIPGDLSSNLKANEDNDGLWTSMYLAAECFRYAVTKDPVARRNAVRTFEAMEKLETVTGIPGFPARTFVAATDSIKKSGSPYPRIWHLSADGKWKWLGGTSSDEIVGHMFAFPLFYDLVAEGEMKERARNVVHRVMDHIIGHNYHLIDYDGKPTRWGIWNPDSLNNSPKGWWYERGLNSLQILSFLKTALYVTGDQKFEQTYQILNTRHHYAKNASEVKRYGPYENSHSDDILAYLPYYNLLRYGKEDQWSPEYIKGLQRCWNVSRPDNTPAWNIMASAALKTDCNLGIAISELRKIPMDMIEWTMDNSHRWDLQKDQLTDRSGQVQSVIPVPAPEAGIPWWNRNPRQYRMGSNGTIENEGTYFLLPYWMGRFYGFFRE